MQKYQKTAITRPKSTLNPGRQPFRGTLHVLDEFDREKSEIKGKKMQKITSQIRDT